MFAYQVALGPAVELLVRDLGVIARDIVAGWDRRGAAAAAADAASRVFAAGFLHAGYLHVLGNLLYLKVFGERVELRLGPLRFLAFYLAGGAVGAVIQIASAPDDPTPVIGASGAIAGVLGLYVVLFPAARITTLFPALVTLTFIELPALLFVGFWALQQALNGYLALAEGLGADDVAWAAHLGGFGFGLVVGGLLRLRGAQRRSPTSGPPPSRQRPARSK